MKSAKKLATSSSKGSSSSIKGKKNINRSPVKAKTPVPAPGGFIETFETAVADIVISIVFKYKQDRSHGAFIKPLIDSWRSGDPTTETWYVDSAMPRREGNSNEPMKSTPGMPYDWYSIVTLRGSPEETPTEIGEKLAMAFSTFSSPGFEMKSFQFMSDISKTPPLSLNHYLLDGDCVLYLKKIYFGVTKDEIMEDDETLAEFFGTAEEGRRILSCMTDAEWERKMWYD